MSGQLTFRRTRLAPTPSGYLHIGNILSFAITATLARQTGADILLRIDDFDLERTNLQYVQDIFDTLNFLELPWDEGPRNVDEYQQTFSQVHRMQQYHHALEQLKNDGRLFACTCSRTQVLSHGADAGYPGTCRNKQLPLDTPNTSWRIHTDSTRQVTVRALKGHSSTTLPTSMTDFIVKRKDGVPAYQLISVVDDVHYGVDLVVRGEDLWPSTVAQLYLADAMGLGVFSQTTFYHHPLVMDAGGRKLSKSEGDTSVHHLRKAGQTKQDIYTAIAACSGISERISSWEELAALLRTLMV